MQECLSDISIVECALVLIDKEENGVIFATLQTTARLYYATAGLMERDALYEAMYIKDELMKAVVQQGQGTGPNSMNEVIFQDKHYCLEGDWRDEKQVWCID